MSEGGLFIASSEAQRAKEDNYTSNFVNEYNNVFLTTYLYCLNLFYIYKYLLFSLYILSFSYPIVKYTNL